MIEQLQWQLDAGAPELYQRHLVSTMTSMWATDLADRAELRPGENVLDLACGTGVLARVAAERVGVSGRVAALDINPGMLNVARSLPPPVGGAAIEWCEGSATAMPYPDAGFQAVVCQLGLQFFPDQLAALRQIRRVLVPGGRLALNVFGPIEHNPATWAMADALDREVHPGASEVKRTEHNLAGTDKLRALVDGAGLQEVVLTTTTKSVHFPSVSHYVRAQMTATPLATLLQGYESARRNRILTALTEDVAAALAGYAAESGLTFPQEVHIVLARR
jgi:ubiquinone/menaquinone biosynthesis C-methylase UbiE